ncbi:hypothetical protein Tco_0436478 [Tanacetum coccineum]
MGCHLSFTPDGPEQTIAILDFDLKKFREMVDVYDFVCIQVSEKDVQDMFDSHLKLDCRQLKLGCRQVERRIFNVDGMGPDNVPIMVRGKNIF